MTDSDDLIRAGRTLSAVVGSLISAVLLRSAFGLTQQAPVLAVTLALTLSRVPLSSGRSRVEAAVEVPLVALAAGGIGWVIVHQPWFGQPLLVLGLSVGILARRFRPAVRRAGRLVALPFLALLIAPAPPAPGQAAAAIAWAPVLAGIALAWTLAVGLLFDRFVGSRRASSLEAGSPEPGPTPDPGSGSGSRRQKPRRLDAPTRMALQMATGLAAALAVGHLLFGDRWGWTVLSAFLVASGNRGRGDVVHKAGLRLVGAALGTVLATAVAVWVPRGNIFVLVLLFGVMAAALVLRNRSYAWWAAGVTAMVALLYGYYGESGAHLLTERLLGVLVGSALGVAAAWFVTPVRTRDVFRRRVADCLAALTDDLADDPAGGPVRYPLAVARLDELAPALSAHRRFSGRVSGRLGGRLAGQGHPHAMQAVEALRALDPPSLDPRSRQRLRRDVVRVRRAMVGRDDPTADQLAPPLSQVHVVLRAAARR